LAEAPQLDWHEMASEIHWRVETARQQQRPSRTQVFQRAFPPALKPVWAPAAALTVMLLLGGYVTERYGAPPAAKAVLLNASAGSVELRVGDQQVLTLSNSGQKGEQVNWRVSADTVSARYLDADTGYITVNNVYTQ
jgi:hypothetical protein